MTSQRFSRVQFAKLADTCCLVRPDADLGGASGQESEKPASGRHLIPALRTARVRLQFGRLGAQDGSCSLSHTETDPRQNVLVGFLLL